MTKSCLHILLFLYPCVLLSGQDAVCGYRWLSEQQDSATSLRVDYTARLLDSLARNATVEYRAEIVIRVVVHVVWQKSDENISDERIFSQIEALNRDFNGENADLSSVPIEFEAFISKQGIRFCLAAAICS